MNDTTFRDSFQSELFISKLDYVVYQVEGKWVRAREERENETVSLLFLVRLVINGLWGSSFAKLQKEILRKDKVDYDFLCILQVLLPVGWRSWLLCV